MQEAEDPGERGWLVERLVPGGDGFGRAPDGRAAFVRGGLPGDRFTPEEVDERRSHVRVSAFTLLRGGPDRVTPRCPWAGRCGGCDWMALERGAQLRWKGRLVAEAMGRTGGRDVEPPLVEDTDGWGWRRRIRLHHDPATGQLGFRARRSHSVVAVDRCLVADPRLQEGLEQLRAEPLPAAVEQVELRVADEGPLLAVVHGRSRGVELRRWLKRTARRLAVYALDERWDSGGQQSVSVLGQPVPAPASGFVQVHAQANEQLVAAVRDGLVQRGARRVLELYAGAGNFTLPLRAAGLQVFPVEGEASSARAAGGKQGDARVVARQLAEAGRRYDAVLLDPPRAGAPKLVGVLQRLAPLIAWVGCDPVALARDLKDAPGRLSLQAFDLFPQTHHVETLAWLEDFGAA